MSPPRPTAAKAPATTTTTRFQYIGGSGLTVQGPVSKRIYRFGAPGSVVAVDPRDAAALTRVTQLRRA